MTLHDGAYNADRNVATGNPYKELLTDLMKHGVQIVWRDCEGSQLGERGFASRNQGQQECHGENGAARSRGFCQNYGMNPEKTRTRRIWTSLLAAGICTALPGSVLQCWAQAGGIAGAQGSFS